MRQPELLPREAAPIRPKGDRQEPRLWVKKLTIWRKRGDPIREIPLKPGLNVIWSPDASAGSGVIGHGSGKTMLCRMIRYCLGENSFAPDGQRSRIWEALPDGFLSSEVKLDGDDWLIVRSLGHARRDFALKNATIDDTFAEGVRPTGLKPFTDAVTAAFIDKAADLMPVRVGPASAWEAALAWLARDQECRFDKLLHWRDPGSDSRSPIAGSGEGERLEIVRALIGSLTPAELASRREGDALEQALARQKTDLGHRDWELKTLATRIGSALGMAAAPSPSELEAQVVDKMAKERLAKTMGVPSKVTLADLTSARAQWNEALEKLRTSQSNLALSEAKNEAAVKILGLQEGELGPLSVHITKGEIPYCPVCKVAIDKVLAEGCGITVESCDLEALKAEFERKRGEAEATKSDISRLRGEIQRLKADVALAGQQFANLDKALKAVEAAQAERSRQVRAAERIVDDAERFAHAVAARQKAMKEIEANEAQVVKVGTALAAHRSQASDIINQVSRRFDDVLRDLVPGDVTGSAKLDGNGLHLRVAMGDEGRTSAAIESLKIVAFDIAVLVRSIEGETSLPALLIHDSPREADLGRSIYDLLFEYAVKLEQVGGAPRFQYIVTTTTAPPDAIRIDPWLRLELHGSPTDQRLLKLDL